MAYINWTKLIYGFKCPDMTVHPYTDADTETKMQ